MAQCRQPLLVGDGYREDARTPDVHRAERERTRLDLDVRLPVRDAASGKRDAHFVRELGVAPDDESAVMKAGIDRCVAHSYRKTRSGSEVHMLESVNRELGCRPRLELDLDDIQLLCARVRDDEAQ